MLRTPPQTTSLDPHGSRLLPALRRLALLTAAGLLAGCNSMVLMSPSGDIAMRQRDLIIASSLLMMLIIVPVIVLTFMFAWRYRAANNAVDYAPDWNHSTQLELVIWAAPLLIVIALGALTWISTHELDPYRPLSRLDAERSIPANAEPLVVEVVALDWKWLFLYPELGIATVNELAAPVDRPISFRITASSVMNSFFIPALAGQIYAMPGMETKLHAVINKPGEFDGFSANYSGAGFSGMRFKFHGLGEADFNNWVQQAKVGGTELTRGSYLALAQPSANTPVSRYKTVDAGLYQAILNRCVEPNRMCIKEMAAIDAGGGQGKPGTYNVASLDVATRSRLGLATDARGQPAKTYVGAMCTVANPEGKPL